MAKFRQINQLKDISPSSSRVSKVEAAQLWVVAQGEIRARTRN